VTRRQGTPQTLGLPEHTDLPYFAYGLFKPGELAHGQVDALLDGVPVEAWVPGALYVRDGLPLLKPGGMDTVHGYLLRFRQDKSEEAYATISAFELRKHYRWGTLKLGETNETANTLLGRRPEKGSIRHEEGDWTGRRDPVLTRGLPVVHDVAAKQAQEEFRSSRQVRLASLVPTADGVPLPLDDYRAVCRPGLQSNPRTNGEGQEARRRPCLPEGIEPGSEQGAEGVRFAGSYEPRRPRPGTRSLLGGVLLLRAEQPQPSGEGRVERW
jgi:gamma-glutamylcyclotransferase (GGCT)/AIG2-like uncharacterized protein YtfP